MMKAITKVVFTVTLLAAASLVAIGSNATANERSTGQGFGLPNKPPHGGHNFGSNPERIKAIKIARELQRLQNQKALAPQGRYYTVISPMASRVDSPKHEDDAIN
ncbi:MAG: hypothetical protein AAGE61_17830 [Pseudomonadota bacterium]